MVLPRSDPPADPPRSHLDTGPGPVDRRGRLLRDLRLSVTDRCNFRCPYCMPRDRFGPGHAFLDPAHALRPAEITRLVRVFARLGVVKVRLTGGEPLLRPDLAAIVADLRASAPGLELAVTTNGSLLRPQASALAAAGLNRVTVSLDALDPEVGARMADAPRAHPAVLEGIEAAQAAGLPIKINTVVIRGRNEDQVLPLAAWCRERRLPLRFIEYMDVGTSNRWRLDDVVPTRALRDRLGAVWPIEPLEPAYRGEVAVRYRYADGGGEVGFISSVSAPFCGDCQRARVTADGRLHTCLFSSAGHDLLHPLRAGAGDDELEAQIERLWSRRIDRYSEERAGLLDRGETRPRAEMSYLGG